MQPLKVSLRLCVFALLLGLAVPAWPLALPAAYAAQPLSLLPQAISASVPLGGSTNVVLQLSNTSQSAIEARVYEARQQPPQLQAELPLRLRRVRLPAQATRIDPALRQAHLQSSVAQPFIIYLADQADLSPAYAIKNWSQRGQLVYDLLRQHAEHSQRALRALLRQRGLRFEPLWMVNAIIAHGTSADVEAISARQEVALLQADVQIPAPRQNGVLAAISNCNSDAPASTSCWNIRKIGADRVWKDFGLRGEGVTVASIDTGVAVDHPMLRTSYRGYRGDLPPSNDYNWFDPSGRLTAPADASGHGTHTMGVLAGGGSSSSQPAIGVAPGARWIAARGCDVSECSESDLLRSAQWLLAPTDSQGSNPRPDLRPMIVNNSWGTDSGRAVYSGYVAAWRAAGMFPVFANGNTGAGRPPRVCGLVLSPADYPDAVGVGATDANDRIGGFSLYGPAIDGDGTQRLKPDFSAPGVSIVSAAPGSEGYRILSGTSMATPHLAGTVALLWSANPELIGDYDATYALLRDSALPVDDTYCGDSSGGPNNIYGYGRIDSYAAVARAQVDLPWLEPISRSVTLAAGASLSLTLNLDARRVPGPGVYEGRVLVSADATQPPAEVAITLTVTPIAGQAVLQGVLRDSRSVAPVQGEVVVNGGPRVASDATGSYSLTLPVGSYELRATALSHFARSATLALSQTTQQDFSLDADVARIVVPTDTLPISVGLRASTIFTVSLGNAGTQPLVYSAELPASSYAVTRSDAGGPAFQWIDLPADAVDISAQLAAQGASQAISLPFGLRFFGTTFSSIYVGRDGFLSFDQPDLSQQQGVCVPLNGSPGSLIALFKTRLALGEGGRVRYASRGIDSWVVSYEHMTLADGGGGSYSFQVLLNADGQLRLQYRELGSLPAALTLGVQASSMQGQSLGCRQQVRLAANQAITLLPQPPGSDWALVRGREGLLAPGHSASISIEVAPLDLRLSGQCGQAQQLKADLKINSSDNERPQLLVPLAITRASWPRCQVLSVIRR